MPMAATHPAYSGAYGRAGDARRLRQAAAPHARQVDLEGVAQACAADGNTDAGRSADPVAACTPAGTGEG